MIAMIRKMINSITNFTQQIIDYLDNKRKWKLKIYFLNQLVCTKRIEKFDDIADIFKKPYICRIHKKHIFKTNNTQVVLIPNKALFRDESRRQLHINCTIYEGVDVNGV